VLASLYTKEFYEAVAAHLAEGGVFLQWIQGYETDTLTIQTVARTLSSVLPSLEAWQTESGDIVFIASMKHRVLDASALRRRILEEPFRYALPRTLLIQDLEGLLGRYLASESLLAELVREPGVEVNTDDRNLIEYAFARGVGNGRVAVSERLLTLAMKRKQDRPDVAGAVDWERVAELRPRAWLITGEAPPRLPMPSEGAQARAAAVTVGCQGNYAGALKTWEAASGVGPRDDIEVFVLGMALSERGDERAVAYAERLVANGFPGGSQSLACSLRSCERRRGGRHRRRRRRRGRTARHAVPSLQCRRRGGHSGEKTRADAARVSPVPRCSPSWRRPSRPSWRTTNARPPRSRSPRAPATRPSAWPRSGRTSTTPSGTRSLSRSACGVCRPRGVRKRPAQPRIWSNTAAIPRESLRPSVIESLAFSEHIFPCELVNSG